MLVDASSSGNIKPAMVIDAFMAENNEILQENAFTVTREDTYLNTGTAPNPVFEPLDQIGSVV